jgi:hypothetical protein
MTRQVNWAENVIDEHHISRIYLVIYEWNRQQLHDIMIDKIDNTSEELN